MFGYKVKIDQHLDYSCDEESDKEYDNWSEEYSNSFKYISSTSDKYPEIVSPEEFKSGDTVYVVWVEWSSGDSLGHADRGQVEPLAVFSSEADAIGLNKCINDMNNEKYSFTASTGQVFASEYAPWCGYFENLDSVNIETTVMQENMKNNC